MSAGQYLKKHTIWRLLSAGACACLGLGWIFSGGTAALHLSAALPNTSTLDGIDAYVQQQAWADSIPGIAYAVVDKGQMIHMAALGVSGPDERPMTPQTPMMIASVGKTMTALAVRQLVNAGKINLDAAVQQYLPWFRAADARASQQITVGNLLFHTSGFSTLSGNDPALYRPGPSTEELVRGLANVPLNRPVGSAVEYSNLNYLVLGQVIAAASGVPYEQYVQKNIYDPLEMRQSYFAVEDAKTGGMGSGYRFYFGLPLAVETPFPQAMMSAGFHISSVEDMAHYLIAFSNHGLYKNQWIANPGQAPSAADAGLNYDIDWAPFQVSQSNNTPGHSGAWLNYSSGLLYMPDRQIGVVVLSNANPAQFLPAGSTFEIALGVLKIYTGNAPAASRPALITLYLLVDGILMIAAALVFSRWVGARRWRERTAHQGYCLRALVPSFIVDLVLPLLLLLLAPVAAASLPGSIEWSPVKNWSRLLFTVPDFSSAWLCLSAALLLVGLLKLVWVLVDREKVHPASVSPFY